jgi:spermidine/putrescine transport system substrate-binding protein
MKRLVLLSLFVLGVSLVGCSRNASTPGTSGEIRVLAWAGYEEPDLLAALQNATGLHAVVKTYVGGDQMFTLLTQSKGEYDVVVVDPEYVAKLHAVGRLKPIADATVDTTRYFSYFKTFPTARIDGQLYAVPIRFGVNALAYNTKHFTAGEVESYQILLGDKARGRVGVWDWYLPEMGTLSKAVGVTGNPYDLTSDQFASLEGFMHTLRGSVKAISATPAEVMAGLGSDDIWIVPGMGEIAAAALQQQGKPIDWIVPKEGGIMWVECVVIPNDTRREDAALKYLKWMTSAGAQALLSQRRAYNSNVPNVDAYSLLTAEQRRALKVNNEVEGEALISRVTLRSLPASPSEQTWQAAWQAFKAGS